MNQRPRSVSEMFVRMLAVLHSGLCLEFSLEDMQVHRRGEGVGETPVESVSSCFRWHRVICTRATHSTQEQGLAPFRVFYFLKVDNL